MPLTPDRARRAAAALVLALAPAAPLATQAPRVRVEFQLADPIYVQSFDSVTEVPQLQDSAAAMLVRVLTRHLRFLSFTRDPADSGRVLSVILDQQQRGSPSQFGERGLHVYLRTGSIDPPHLYWRIFRTLGVAGRDTVGSVATFLTEFGRMLDDLDPAAWHLLVTDLLSRISIADTNAVAWAEPPGSASPNEWLIPLRADSACFDPDDSRLRIRNEVVTRGRRFVVTAKPADVVPDDTTAPATLRRFKGLVRAPLDSPATATAAPIDSIHVRAVFVTKYKFDDVGCASLALPEGGGR